MTAVVDAMFSPLTPIAVDSPLVEVVIEGLVDDVRTLQREVSALQEALRNKDTSGQDTSERGGRFHAKRTGPMAS